MRVGIEMEPIQNRWRSRVNLGLGLAIGVVFCVINIGVNYPDRIHALFTAPASSPYVRIGLNILFGWLAILLGLAFYRWRQAECSNANLENVISGISPDALCVVNPVRVIVMCNPSVRRLFGYGEDEIVGKCTDLLYYDRRRRSSDPREIYNELERKGYHIGIATGRRANGTEFPLEIISGDLPERKGAVLLMRDITDRVNEEEARRQAEAHIRDREHLEHLAVLAGGVAHDFNNLLSGILGNAELALVDVANGADVRRCQENIIANVDRASSICRDLLAYAGKGKVVARRFSLSGAVQNEKAHLMRLDGGAAKLQYDLAADETTLIDGDSRQIRQLVLNLATNAVEAVHHRADGRVTLRTRVADAGPSLLSYAIGNTSGMSGRYAVLDVVDNGYGMTEVVRRNLFNPFFSTKFPGRGLGLSSVQGIVRSHGGWMQVASTEGQGSTITVILPLAKEGRLDEGATEQPAGAAGREITS